MLRRLNRTGNRRFEEEGPDPMAGMANLADVMLVLAVGIMLALIINWHISVSGGTVTQMDKGTMTEVDRSEFQETTKDGSAENSSNLEEKGKVYIDKNTGTMYLVEPNDE